jgi:hypothetical protein
LTLSKSCKRKLQAAEIRFLRSVAGVALLDEKRSEDIRKDVKIFSVTDKQTIIEIGRYNI